VFGLRLLLSLNTPLFLSLSRARALMLLLHLNIDCSVGRGNYVSNPRSIRSWKKLDHTFKKSLLYSANVFTGFIKTIASVLPKSSFGNCFCNRSVDLECRKRAILLNPWYKMQKIWQVNRNLRLWWQTNPIHVIKIYVEYHLLGYNAM
jgi:hypothetical protein